MRYKKNGYTNYEEKMESDTCVAWIDDVVIVEVGHIGVCKNDRNPRAAREVLEIAVLCFLRVCLYKKGMI